MTIDPYTGMSLNPQTPLVSIRDPKTGEIRLVSEDNVALLDYFRALDSGMTLEQYHNQISRNLNTFSSLNNQVNSLRGNNEQSSDLEDRLKKAEDEFNKVSTEFDEHRKQFVEQFPNTDMGIRMSVAFTKSTENNYQQIETLVRYGHVPLDPKAIGDYYQKNFGYVPNSPEYNEVVGAAKMLYLGRKSQLAGNELNSLRDQVRRNNGQASFQSLSGSNSDLVNSTNQSLPGSNSDLVSSSNNGPGSNPTYYEALANPGMISSLLDFAREEFNASKDAPSAKERKVHEVKGELSVIAGLMTANHTYQSDSQLGGALADLHMDYRLQDASPDELKAAAAQILNELDPESQNLLINGRPLKGNYMADFMNYGPENVNPFSPLHQFIGLFKDLVGTGTGSASTSSQQDPSLRFIKVTIYNNRFNTPVTKAFSEISQSLNDPQFTTSDKNLITEIAKYVSKPSTTLRGIGLTNFGQTVETNPWTNLNLPPDLSPEKLQEVAGKLDNIAASLKATDPNKGKSFETVSIAIKGWAGEWGDSQTQEKKRTEITANGAIEKEKETDDKANAILDGIDKDFKKIDTVIDKSKQALLNLGKGGTIDDNEFLSNIIAARKLLIGSTQDWTKNTENISFRLNRVGGNSDEVNKKRNQANTEYNLKLQMLDILLYGWGSKAQENLSNEQKKEIQKNYAPGELSTTPGIDYNLPVDEFKKSLLANLERLKFSLYDQSGFTGRAWGSDYSLGDDKDFAPQELVNTLIHEDAFTNAFGYYFIDPRVSWYIYALTPRKEGMSQKEYSIAAHDTYLKGLKEGVDWRSVFENKKVGNNINSPDFSIFNPPSIETSANDEATKHADDIKNQEIIARIFRNLSSAFPGLFDASSENAEEENTDNNNQTKKEDEVITLTVSQYMRMRNNLAGKKIRIIDNPPMA